MEIVGLLAPSAELNDLDRLLHQRRAHCFHGEYGAVLEVILKMIT